MSERLETQKIERELLQLTQREYKGNLTRNLHTLDLINKGIKLFEWGNVPKTITNRTIEKLLFFHGKLMFFHHETLGYIVTPFTFVGGVNYLNEFTKVRPLVVGDLSSQFNKDYEIGVDCVIIRDNELMVAPVIYAIFLGEKISKLYSDREKNNLWLTLPLIFQSSGDLVKDKKKQKEIEKVLLSNGFEVAIISSIFEDITMFNIKTQYLGAEIQEQIKVLKNDFLEYLGIDNSEQKKERKITLEQEAENEETSINLEKRLSPRMEAIQEIKEIFNLDLTIDVKKSSLATEYLDQKQNVDSKSLIVDRGRLKV